MYRQPLAEATAEKDLGVVFSNDLKVLQQCREAYSKANQILGLVRRTIAFKNPAVLIFLYKSLVRPHLENCSVTWSPHYTKDTVLLERVQHWFTRMFSELKYLPHKQPLAKFKLWSLEERRKRADLIEIFKMIKGFSAALWFHFFTRVENSITRGHNCKLAKTSCHDSRLFFFYQSS